MYCVWAYDEKSDIVSVLDTLDRKIEKFNRKDLKFFITRGITVDGAHVCLDGTVALDLTTIYKFNAIDRAIKILNAKNGILGLETYVRVYNLIYPVYREASDTIVMSSIANALTRESFQNVNLDIINEIVVGENCKSITDSSFYGLTNLKNVILNDGLTSIGSDVFIGTSVKNIRIPNTLETLGARGLCLDASKPLGRVLLPKKMVSLSNNSVHAVAIRAPSAVKNISSAVHSVFYKPSILAINEFQFGLFGTIFSEEAIRDCWLLYKKLIVCTDDKQTIKRLFSNPRVKLSPYASFDYECKKLGV